MSAPPEKARTPAGRAVARAPGRARPRRLGPKLAPWLTGQAVNVTRHARALRSFQRHEFGAGSEAPTEAHIQAVNSLMASLRGELLRLTTQVDSAVATALQLPSTTNLQRALRYKERAHDWVQAIERVWDFYFELFGQRQTRFGTWLLGCDRIALDCYTEAYMGLGVARPVPAPPPFSYMRTGFSPATFRRNIPLRRLGRQLNPFPLIQLPYHRLINPWTLGAVLHEVSHNLQNDLGLERAVPRNIARRLLAGGYGSHIASIWTRWNREAFADLSGLLLGGPAVVGSLMDVIGRGPAMVTAFREGTPHPTPYLRAFVSIELLRRMGFPNEARAYEQLWRSLYPDPGVGNIPPPLLRTWPEVIPLVVDTVCFQPYVSLGDRSLAEVLRFAPKEQQMVEEAAGRLGKGTDPGVIPARFLIGAARVAFERRLAPPEVITHYFYHELARR
ncbi:MAG: hypothetical protein HXY37_01140 [Chloroflexi bacterium]|nr:hypothetical protein [Chloroflexota bacterium]